MKGTTTSNHNNNDDDDDDDNNHERWGRVLDSSLHVTTFESPRKRDAGGKENSRWCSTLYKRKPGRMAREENRRLLRPLLASLRTSSHPASWPERRSMGRAYPLIPPIQTLTLSLPSPRRPTLTSPTNPPAPSPPLAPTRTPPPPLPTPHASSHLPRQVASSVSTTATPSGSPPPPPLLSSCWTFPSRRKVSSLTTYPSLPEAPAGSALPLDLTGCELKRNF